MTDKKKSEEKHKEHHSKKSKISKIKNLSQKANYWAISTTVLAILLIVMMMTGGTTGAIVSQEQAGQNVLSFAKNQGAEATLINASDEGSLYQIVLSIKGQDGTLQNVPVYVTKDGKTLVPQPISLETKATPKAPSTSATSASTEIPKSDNPEVELFIWAYCPYGVMAQAPFAEVASLLEDSATFKAIMYHDGHGAYETQQNKIQACIQKINNENYWEYAKGFTEDIYPNCGQSRDIDCDKTESIKLMDSLGINSKAVMTCVDSEGTALIGADVANARNNGVTGSPTILINGVKANVARNAEAIKAAICSAYNDAPAECSNTLDATEAQAQGNC